MFNCFPKVKSSLLLFPSQSQALAHYKGTKHAKKLKAHDAPKSKLKGSVVTKDTPNQEITKGINTSQVPNSSNRKGLWFLCCCCRIFSSTCSVVFFLWQLLYAEEWVVDLNTAFWHFRSDTKSIQPKQELDQSLLIVSTCCWLDIQRLAAESVLGYWEVGRAQDTLSSQPWDNWKVRTDLTDQKCVCVYNDLDCSFTSERK